VCFSDRFGAVSARGDEPSHRAVSLLDENLAQNRVVLPQKSRSVDADQDFSAVLADWSGLGR
jgi:hypothetical protein